MPGKDSMSYRPYLYVGKIHGNTLSPPRRRGSMPLRCTERVLCLIISLIF